MDYSNNAHYITGGNLDFFLENSRFDVHVGISNSYFMPAALSEELLSSFTRVREFSYLSKLKCFKIVNVLESDDHSLYIVVSEKECKLSLSSGSTRSKRGGVVSKVRWIKNDNGRFILCCSYDFEKKSFNIYEKKYFPDGFVVPSFSFSTSVPFSTFNQMVSASQEIISFVRSVNSWFVKF